MKKRFFQIIIAILTIAIIGACEMPEEAEEESTDDSVKTTSVISFVKNADDAQGEMDSLTVEQNTTVSLPANQYSRSGYSFSGWNTEADGSGSGYADNADFETGDSDVELFAQWDSESVDDGSGKEEQVDDGSGNEEQVDDGTGNEEQTDDGTGHEEQPAENKPFISKWDVADTLRFPLSSDGEYDCVIDWGDGTKEELTSVSGKYVEHEYASAGTYTVTVTGTCKGFGYQSMFVGDNGDGELLDVTQWGTVMLHNKSKGKHFKDCLKLTGFTATDAPDTSNVTDFSESFCGAIEFSADLSKWDTSNVILMEKMFYEAEKFNGDISTWDTSKVTDMSYMFQKAYAFNKDISTWDTSQVTDMGYMFKEATVFNADLSKWKTSKVESMKHMFYLAKAFNSDVSGWDTAKVKYMTAMFNTAEAFNCGGIDISGWTWDLTSCTDKNNMFNNSLLYGSEPSWY